jgi:hypothetical protein
MRPARKEEWFEKELGLGWDAILAAEAEYYELRSKRNPVTFRMAQARYALSRFLNSYQHTYVSTRDANKADSELSLSFWERSAADEPGEESELGGRFGSRRKMKAGLLLGVIAAGIVADLNPTRMRSMALDRANRAEQLQIDVQHPIDAERLPLLFSSDTCVSERPINRPSLAFGNLALRSNSTKLYMRTPDPVISPIQSADHLR